MAATNEMNIKFPILLYLDDVLTVDKDGAAMEASFPDRHTMLCKEIMLNHSPGWILDAAGVFIDLMPSGKRRVWARPLSFLWRFTLSEYSVSCPGKITVGELKGRIENINDKFPEAPVASDLRLFLRKYKDNELVTGEILRSWPI